MNIEDLIRNYAEHCQINIENFPFVSVTPRTNDTNGLERFQRDVKAIMREEGNGFRIVKLHRSMDDGRSQTVYDDIVIEMT